MINKANIYERIVMLGGTAFSLPVIRAGSLDHYLNIRNIFIPILLDKLIDDIEVDQLVGRNWQFTSIS